MHRVSVKFVTRLLSDDQKENRFNISQEMLDRASAAENVIKNIIIGDETWAYGYDVETKALCRSGKRIASTKKKPG